MVVPYIKQRLRSFIVARKLTRQNVSLLYHLVGNEQYSKGLHANAHFVNKDTAISHLRGLQKRMKFLADEEFFDHIRSGSNSFAASLTFDDGYKSTWDTLIPVLEELRVPSTFYLNSSTIQGQDLWRDRIRFLIDHNLAPEFIDENKLNHELRVEQFYLDTKDPKRMNSQIIKEMLDRFFSNRGLKLSETLAFCTMADLSNVSRYRYVKLGNHTHSHYVLSTLPKNEQINDIGICQRFLIEHFPSEKISRVFSMPFGDDGTYNQETIESLKEFGFQGSFTSGTDSYMKSNNTLEVIDGFPMFKRYLPKHYLRLKE